MRYLNYLHITYMWLDFQNRSKSHKNWNPFYCWILNLNSCTIYSETPNTLLQMAKSAFTDCPFAIPVKAPRCTTSRVCRIVVNGINKNRSGARLLPATVLDYPVDYIYLFLVDPNFVASLNEFTLGLGGIGIFISWYMIFREKYCSSTLHHVTFSHLLILNYKLYFKLVTVFHLVI